MGTLKTYPVDLLGTAPSNKIAGEVRTIVKNEDRIFIPTGGPFYSKSLKVWANGTLLTNKQDYEAKELNREATLDSGKEVCNAIHLKNVATTYTLEYQVIGGEYTELARELSDFIAGTPINDLTELNYGSILYKPTTFPPSEHGHVAADWIGYGEANYILDQMKLSLPRGSNPTFEAAKLEAKKKIQERIVEHITQNGIATTNSTPTVNGNILLLGDGTQPSPIKFDVDALHRELDNRYFRNVINPLTRIGAISDSFLPVVAGFFNVTTPFTAGYNSTAVAKVERNGNLLTLTPATNGELVRYVYGYIRGWNTSRNLMDFKPTNIQYRPPGLAGNEEIMQLFSITNQTMLASIYSTAGTLPVFKEHAIVELNDTLIQDGHVLKRVGLAIKNATGAATGQVAVEYRPNIARMRDGNYYIISINSTGTEQGSMHVHRLNGDNSVTRITNWLGRKELRTVEHIADEDDRIVSTVNSNIPNIDSTKIKPFHWYKSAASAGEMWIQDDTLATGDTGFYFSHYDDDLSISIVGDEIHCLLSFVNKGSMTIGGLWVKNLDVLAGASYRLLPTAATPTFYWLRTKAEVEEPASYLVNEDQGYIRQIGTSEDFENTIPYDMARQMKDMAAPSNQIYLADGQSLWWGGRHFNGTPSRLRAINYGRGFDKPLMMMNGYNTNRYYRLNGSRWDDIGPSLFNLENPTSIPIDVAVMPMNENLMLIQTGASAYGGFPGNVDYYLYKPPSNVISYKTGDLGPIDGYDISDDRKLIASNVPAMAFSNSRLANGTCRYSNMIFIRQQTPIEQTVYRNITLNYNTGEIVTAQPYDLTQVGYDAVEFAINALFPSGLRETAITSWALIISPEDPTVALFDCMAAYPGGNGAKIIRTAAKLGWNANNQLISFAIRPSIGEITESGTKFFEAPTQHRWKWHGHWAMQYNNDKTEAHWTGRHLTGLVTSGNTNSSAVIHSYKLTFAGDGFPLLSRYYSSGTMDGRKMVVTTSRGTGMVMDSVGFGVFRTFQPFKNFDWVSGNTMDLAANRAFVYYTPRPTVSFKLRINDVIDVQLGGIYSKIQPGVYELTDPSFSSVTDPRNKKIYVYVTLELGAAKLYFSETAQGETTFNVYIGYCLTDQYGITEANISPVNRIETARTSTGPQGSAVSVSSGTADQQRLLNWDADVPVLLPPVETTLPTGTDSAYLTVTGPNSVNVLQTISLSFMVSPSSYQVNTVQWTSSNTAIATVNGSGQVTGVTIGNVDITCRVNGTLIGTKSLAVSDSNVVVSLNVAPSMHLTLTHLFSSTVTPSNYPVTNKVWSSSDPSKLSISSGGLATALRPGTVTVTCTVNGNKTGTKPVAVNDAMVRLSVTGDDSIQMGDESQMTYSLNYPTMVVDSVKWTSMNPTVITIDDNGVARANEVGSAVLVCIVNGKYQGSKLVYANPGLIETTINLVDHGVFTSDGGYAVQSNKVFNLNGMFVQETGRGPNENDSVTFVLPVGYAIVGPTVDNPAITLGNWPTGLLRKPKLINRGAILGRGGIGMINNPPNGHGAGGPAIDTLTIGLDITNYGIIASGGGGGGKGTSGSVVLAGGGGAPYGAAPPWTGIGSYPTAGTFLTPGQGGIQNSNRAGRGGNWGYAGENGTGGSGPNFAPGSPGVVIKGPYTILNLEAGILRGL